jgi:hypothetical protein
LEILEVSSVDKAANKDSRVLFWKRDSTEEAPVDVIKGLIETVKKSSREEILKVCATDEVSKPVLGQFIDHLAAAQRRDGESPQQAYARFVSEEFGRRLFAIHEASPGRDHWQQAAFEKFTKRSAAPHADGGDGKRHLPGDSEADLEKLVDEYVQTHPKISRATAYGQVLRTPAGKVAYNREKTARLKKAAQLMGSA